MLTTDRVGAALVLAAIRLDDGAVAAATSSRRWSPVRWWRSPPPA
jgi:hypothetical protein